LAIGHWSLSASALGLWLLSSCLHPVLAQPAADSVPADGAGALRIVEQGPVSVSAKLKPRRSTKPLTVGDRFRLELEVKRHRSTRAAEPFADSLGPFLILDTKTVTRYKGDTIVDLHELELAAFAPGELALPRFLVSFPDSGEARAVRSESLGLTIKPVLDEKMEDIRDLKPQVQFPNLLPLWIALGAVLLVVAAVFGRRFLRTLRHRIVRAQPLPDPWDEALASLAQIPAREWLGAGQVKRYYYAVSEILKRYLTRRFGFPALDQTTSEMILAMKAARIELRDEFTAFFRRADLVKYAKLVPERPEMDGVIPAARELVERTQPKPDIKHQDTKSAK